ncbi:type II toxin-antitoxin system VapC family toxin [Candidatus Bathyarchaeota archaeon]|nr:type II toxin-antitoxin system VapC family toxin [Candidatus Bathyarchaeota archaeon]
MAKEVTLDSSVLVSAFVKGDRFRPAALRIMEKVFRGEYHVATSAIVPIEVCGAVSRRAGVDKAVSVRHQLDKWEGMNFIVYSELSRRRRQEATGLAVKLGLRGMDAIVVQVAKEKKAALVTFDEEMAEKAKGVVEVLTLSDS